MRLKQWMIAVLLALVAPAAWGISISVYVAANDVVASPVTGTVTESFNAIRRGTYTTSFSTAVGTVQATAGGAMQVMSEDQYGGASNGRYAAIGGPAGSGGAVALALGQNRTYFGMWWSAIDAANGLSLYSGSALLARFSAAEIMSLFTGSTQITAINGTRYTTANYLGNPRVSANTSEYYAYVMFQANGLTFDRIVFDNSGSNGSGFEMDNWSVRSGSYTLPGTSVLVRDIEVVTPEPDVWIPAAIGLGGAVWWRKRKQKQAA